MNADDDDMELVHKDEDTGEWALVSCDTCRNCLLVDFGYSNYTVEGTTVVCMEQVPDKEFDRFYGTDKRLQYARSCSSYKVGPAETIDVDSEDWKDLSSRAKSFAREQGKGMLHDVDDDSIPDVSHWIDGEKASEPE